MFKTKDYNTFLNKMNKISSIDMKDIDAFFKIDVLDLFFYFPDNSKSFYEKETEIFVIPEKISLIYHFNILNYFIKFCLFNQLTITLKPYSLLAQSKLGYSLFFSTGSSYDNEYGDMLFLINFNNNHFTEYDIHLLNEKELIQYNKYLYSNLHSNFFLVIDCNQSTFLRFRNVFTLDYKDLQYNKINSHIEHMIKRYNKLRKAITPTTEHFFERALLEKNIENF